MYIQNMSVIPVGHFPEHILNFKLSIGRSISVFMLNWCFLKFLNPITSDGPMKPIFLDFEYTSNLPLRTTII